MEQEDKHDVKYQLIFKNLNIKYCDHQTKKKGNLMMKI